MTRKEFESLRVEIQNKKLQIQVDCDPFRYAIERAKYKRNQLSELIAIGRKIKSKTVQAKVARWKRQVEKLEALPTRIHTLFTENSVTRV
jgi:hypothetical protein